MCGEEPDSQANEKRAGSTVRITEQGEKLIVSVPRLPWDSNFSARLVGGFVLIGVGLLQGVVAKMLSPRLATVLLWLLPIAGSWLLVQTLRRALLVRRVTLEPGKGLVEWSLGPLRGRAEFDPWTLQVAASEYLTGTSPRGHLPGASLTSSLFRRQLHPAPRATPPKISQFAKEAVADQQTGQEIAQLLLRRPVETQPTRESQSTLSRGKL
jgi:hypothetical protein